MEYTLDLSPAQNNIRIDVVGISQKNKVAIECGQTQPEKLSVLKLYFNKVIHIPYGVEILTENRVKIEIERKKIEEATKKINLVTNPELEIEKFRKEVWKEARNFYLSCCKRCPGYNKRPSVLKGS